MSAIVYPQHSSFLDQDFDSREAIIAYLEEAISGQPRADYVHDFMADPITYVESYAIRVDLSLLQEDAALIAVRIAWWLGNHDGRAQSQTESGDEPTGYSDHAGWYYATAEES